MKNILQSLKVIVLALVLSFGISYVSAWTAPTATPPGENVAAPINTSTATQYKAGALGVEGLLKGFSDIEAVTQIKSPKYCIGADCITVWPVSGATGPAGPTGATGPQGPIGATGPAGTGGGGLILKSNMPSVFAGHVAQCWGGFITIYVNSSGTHVKVHYPPWSTPPSTYSSALDGSAFTGGEFYGGLTSTGAVLHGTGDVYSGTHIQCDWIS